MNKTRKFLETLGLASGDRYDLPDSVFVFQTVDSTDLKYLGSKALWQ